MRAVPSAPSPTEGEDHRDRGALADMTGKETAVIISVDEAPIEESSIIRNMLQLYIHDFSEFEGFDLNQHGLYGYRYLDHYWTDPDRFPFIVRVNNELAGFALVSTFDRGEYREARFSEFFIVRKYRRRGVGQDVARQVFTRFPGPWVLTERASNVAAQQFWRDILGRLVNGEFTEHVEQDSGRVVQEFVVEPPPAQSSE
jgi:predicted acetyltransferase